MNGEWINTLDDVPPLGKVVFATDGIGTFKAYRSAADGLWYETMKEGYKVSVIWWMPIPKIPRSGPEGPFSFCVWPNGDEVLFVEGERTSFDLADGTARELTLWLNRLWAGK